jgi:hypothetical protein
MFFSEARGESREGRWLESLSTFTPMQGLFQARRYWDSARREDHSAAASAAVVWTRLWELQRAKAFSLGRVVASPDIKCPTRPLLVVGIRGVALFGVV